jgi:hypothetical protein
MQVQDAGSPPPAATVVADYYSTLSTSELQREFRSRPTRPLPELLNRHAVTIDGAQRRIWRDCYWKGSFAKDTLMGWEERLMTPIRPHRPPFAGGRFWKRFDALEDGAATAYIVNYGIGLLPGRALVRQVAYPDDRRKYIARGDDVLLLTYRNQPYRIVYDLIKMVDENHCIGVMHMGTFPKGYEFATFVMTRNNYPFEKMGVPDHDALFGGSETRAPDAGELVGTWKGSLIFHRHPELALHNQFNPPFVRAQFESAGGAVTGQVQVGLRSMTNPVEVDRNCARIPGSRSSHEIRRLDARTLLGRVVRQSRPGVARVRYVLTRADAGGALRA